jgi:exopolysaccharide/PEP-CTERM locus tyrosine autokinase
MGLIEQAAKRLEELRRTGIELPDGLRNRGATDDARDTLAPARPPEHRAVVPERLPVRSTAPVRPTPRLVIDLLQLSQQGLITPDAPHTGIAREFRVIKRPVLENAQGATGAHPKHGNLVMVTSAMAGEGKSFCAVNLAMSIAMELDSTVLLVDADVANPSVLEILGLPQGPGLLDVLTDPTRDLSGVIMRTNVEKLAVLPAGTRHERATELLASEAMTRLVHEMASRYPDRIIVFDSPPLLLTTESPALATHMGQIVLVVEAERTTASTVRQALATVERCPLVMTVLNKAPGSEITAYSGYGYRDAK